MKLNPRRYSAIYQSIVIIDFVVSIVLWLVGAYHTTGTSEFNQIVNFRFTESIFDVLLICSFKTIIIFILINEIEIVTLRLIETEKLTQIQQNLPDETQVFLSEKPSSFDKLKKRILYYLNCVVSLFVSIYLLVKFSMVVDENVKNQNEAKNPVMDNFFFSALTSEFVFSLIQLILAFLEWKAMEMLSKQIRAERLKDDNEKNEDKKKKVDFARLFGLSYPERYTLLLGFVMLLISSVTTIIVPFFFGLVVDAALKYPTLDEMNKYVLYMFLIYFGGSIAGGIRSWLFEMAGQRVVSRLRYSVFSAIIQQDIQFFDSNRTGELTSRISSDTQVLQNTVTLNMSMLARYIIQIIGSVIFMISLEPSLSGLLLAVIPVVTLGTMQYGKFVQKLRKQFQDELASSNVIAEEAISSARTVRSFAAEDKMIDEYTRKVDKSFQVGKKLAVASGGFMGFVGILSAGALSLVMWYGGKLVHDKSITTGVLSSFLMYTLQVAMAFAFLSSLYGDFMQALGASTRIFDLLDSKPKIPPKTGFKPQSPQEDEYTFDGSIILDKISFTYPSRPEAKILHEITFEVNKGQTVALVGPSGSGKSTVFSLIERFYDPESGNIKLGPSQTSIQKVETNWLHSCIALVSQEPVLFGGSIKDNIWFGMTKEPSMSEIEEASKLANAYEFISAMDDGFNTIVGERGIRLSGGQKQRIAIARALLMNPKLLLLDEATSALDSESEHLVQEAIDRAMRGRTVCVIAHRLSTVRNADRVIVIDQGRIVEQGTHDELCQNNGIYKKFVLRQLLTKDPVVQAESESQPEAVPQTHSNQNDDFQNFHNE